MTSLIKSWLSEDYIDLLNAAILPGEQALAAWAAWRARNRVDDIPMAGYRLLPLIYWNLQQRAISHPDMGRLKGVLRLSWSKNHILFREAVPIIQALTDVGMDVMLLKGAVLAYTVYANSGLRMMDDVDILIPFEHYDRALDLLFESGWHSIDFPRGNLVQIRYYRHSAGFGNVRHGQLDLHWYLFRHERDSVAQQSLWAAGRRTDFFGASLLMPDMADVLIHVCRHGLRYNPMPSIRWIVDAHALITTCADHLDWDRVAYQTRLWPVNMALNEALTYLRDSFHTPIPDAAVRQIAAMPVSYIQRLHFDIDSRPQPNRWSRLNRLLPWSWITYLRDEPDKNLWQRLVGFPAFLMRMWNISSLVQLPFRMISTIIKKLRS